MSKAVRECGKNVNSAPTVSQFMNQALNVQHTEEVMSIHLELHGGGDHMGQKSSNNSGNSHSMDESSSTDEAPSRRSLSPPISTNFDQRRGATGTVVESSCGQIAYLSSTQMQNEANLQARFTEGGATPTGSFHDPTPGCTSVTTTSLQSAGADVFYQRKRDPTLVGSGKPFQTRTEYNRWLSSRSAPPQEDFLNSVVQLPLSRFGSEVQNQMAVPNHAEVSYMQGSDVTRSQSTSAASKLDIRINLGFNQQPASLQESLNFGYRNFSSPLMSSNSTGNSLLDTNTQHALSGYAGQFSSSIITPSNVNMASFNSPLAGATAGLRLHEYEVPSPRMVLWDFQE